METPIRVFVIERHALLRESYITNLSNYQLKIVGESECVFEAISSLELTAPDTLLMDIRFPVNESIYAMKIIKYLYPKLKIIILTDIDLDLYVDYYIKLGAKGFLINNKINFGELADYIIRIFNGETYFMHNKYEKN